MFLLEEGFWVPKLYHAKCKRGWGDGSGDEGPAVQPQGSEFEPQNPHEKKKGKSWAWWHALVILPWDADREILGTQWPASLA